MPQYYTGPSGDLLSSSAQSAQQGGIPYKIDFKCEWDLPMFCDLNQEVDLAQVIQEADEDGHANPDELDPFGDQQYLETLPNIGFFKKIK